MKRKVMILVLALGLFLVLTGCGCDHQWEEATCEQPKTCSECGETEGEALGHDWEDATCEEPKTCSECGETEGEALEHEWEDATCAAPKTCAECGETEGEALEHTWVDATTEAPKTCTECGATEGERIITDPRFTTAGAADLIGSWESAVPINDAAGLDAEVFGEIAIPLVMELGNEGSICVTTPEGAAEEFEEKLADAMELLLVALLKESLGEDLSDSEVDEFVKEAYGMSTREYVQSAVAEENFGAMFDEMIETGVYYIEGGQFYTGDSWEDEMDRCGYALVNGVLTIDDLEYEGALIEWTRVAK